MAAKGGDTDEGQCGTCGGAKGKWTPWTNEKGETKTHWISCTTCNGTGKK